MQRVHRKKYTKGTIVISSRGVQYELVQDDEECVSRRHRDPETGRDMTGPSNRAKDTTREGIDSARDAGLPSVTASEWWAEEQSGILTVWSTAHHVTIRDK